MQKIRQRDYFQTFFFKKIKLFIRKKQIVKLSFSIFWKLLTWTYNRNKFLTFQTVDQDAEL